MLGFVAEILGELFLGVVSAALGFAIGSVVHLIVRATRRGLAEESARREVVAPDGGLWSVRVALAPPPLRLALSQRAFGMRREDRQRRRQAGHTDDAVAPDSLFHPSGLVERTDEAAGLVAPVLLVVVVLAVVLLAVELVLVVFVAAIAFGVSCLRRRWQCEVVDPLGNHFHVASNSLGGARAERDRLADQVAAGLDPRRSLDRRPAA